MGVGGWCRWGVGEETDYTNTILSAGGEGDC